MNPVTKRLLPLCLAGAMMVGVAACGGQPAEEETPAGNTPAAETPAGETPAEGTSYVLGYNNFGQGAYPLDLNESVTQYALESM